MSINLRLFNEIAQDTARRVTERYSTSFSCATRLFPPEIRQHIYNIYGFVRFADEIVDTFHAYDKATLMAKFERDYRHALEEGISLNLILQAFCLTQRAFDIPQDLVDAFLHSMKMDLDIKELNEQCYKEYIYGSAEVVGLMCLNIFVQGDPEQYEKLKPYARSLGAAFQKINFLRDISADYNDLNRTYFPGVNFREFSERDKQSIEQDIAADFRHALEGIRMLPASSQKAVYMAYKYYINLFRKIKKCSPETLMKQRIRVSNARKAYLYGEMILLRNFSIVP